MRTHIHSLVAEHNDIAYGHHCDVNDNDYLSVEKSFQELGQAAKLLVNTVSVYDMNKRQFLFRSMANENSVEHPIYAYHAGLHSDHYSELIHPEDLQMVLESQIKAYALVETLQPQQLLNHKLCCLFRVKNKQGNYQLLHYRIGAYRLDRNNNLWLLLICSPKLTDLSNHFKASGYYLGTFDNQQGNWIDGNKRKRKQILTQRRAQVLQLIMDGYNNAEIVDMLGVRPYTVDKHRREIANVLGANDIVQAAVFALKMGL